MALHLNGWRRLWLMLVAISAAFALVLGYAMFPTSKDVPASAELVEKLPAEHRKLLKGLIPDDGLKAQFPNGHVLAFRHGVTETQTLPVAKAYAAIIQDELGASRKHFIVFLFLTWLAPLVFLYFLGEGIAWVRRGFKSAPPA